MVRPIRTISIPAYHGKVNDFSRKGRSDWVSWLMELTEWHEHRRQYVYINGDDSAIIGVGFDLHSARVKKEIKDLGLSHKSIMARITRLQDREINKLFDLHIDFAIHRANKWVRNFHELDDARKAAVAYLCYIAEIKNFNKLAEFIEKEDWEKASDNLSKSKWYKNSGKRGPNVALILRLGRIEGIA